MGGVGQGGRRSRRCAPSPPCSSQHLHGALFARDNLKRGKSDAFAFRELTVGDRWQSQRDASEAPGGREDKIGQGSFPGKPSACPQGAPHQTRRLLDNTEGVSSLASTASPAARTVSRACPSRQQETHAERTDGSSDKDTRDRNPATQEKAHV